MSPPEDEAAADTGGGAREAPEAKKPASIPAPSTVPRPSRPPPPAAPAAAAPAAPSPGAAAAAGGAPGTSPGPASQRRAAHLPYGEEDFDAEKTMVVEDPDDAPTADYDPRANYDPRARGTYAQGEAPGPPRTASGITRPDLPAARVSDTGRKRTSRRTVRIPEDPVRRAERPPAAVVVEQAPAAPPGGSNGEPADTSLVARAAEFNEEVTEEITVVKPLRIISIGSDPPPPIRSAFATWPPGSSLANDLVEAGWTPVPPEVAAVARLDAEAAPVTEEEPPTPVAPPVHLPSPDEVVTARAPLTSSPEIAHEEYDPERVEVLEDIEPDAASLPPPKRPPPPPPKKVEVRVEVPDPNKAKPWYEDIFSEEYLRTHDRPELKLVRREVDFIEESLGVEKHAVVLDLACGMGDHALELAGRGYTVHGLDLSRGMLEIAERGAKRRYAADPGYIGPALTHRDMREMDYEEAYDGIYCWGTSFGYFDEDVNLSVLGRAYRALRQGGMFLLDVVNRDYVAPRSPSLVWFEGTQCVCMDDMHIDFLTSRMRVKRTAMFEGGLSRELDYSIRLYSLNELGKMLHEVGFRVVEVTGHPSHPGVFFGTESPRLIILAERS